MYDSFANSNRALTDKDVGGAWVGPNRESNLAWVNGFGSKAYIQVDLGSVQDIDSISLWGRDGLPAESNNLRLLVSSEPFANSAQAFAELSIKPGAAIFDVAEVDTKRSTSVNDTIKGIESLVGTDMADVLIGDDKSNVLTGGKGQDVVNAGGGNDKIIQAMERFAEILDGGDGNDTVDYQIPNADKNVYSIDARLSENRVIKTFYGTNLSVGKAARYIRIYHNDAASATQALSLTGLKVFAGGVDISQTPTGGLESASGADSGVIVSALNNRMALTDGDVGLAWNGLALARSNLAYSAGTKPYIELDLGAQPAGQVIDSISLWGRAEAGDESSNLRVYMSDTAFSPSATYASLAASSAVTAIDVAAVDTSPSTTFADTLVDVENVLINGSQIGGTGSGVKNRRMSTTSLASSGAYDNTITGNAKANVLLGSGKNDLVNGGDGDDTLLGDAGNDRVEGGAGEDLLSGGVGQDYVSGGDGDDRIGQDLEAVAETLDGGAGIDTVDYSIKDLTGIPVTLTVDLAAGTATKVFEGTSVSFAAPADNAPRYRYIRIYHSDATAALALTELKVFSNGVNVAAAAAGKVVSFGGDSLFNDVWTGGNPINNPAGAFNPSALTDGKGGGSGAVAYVTSTKPGVRAYIDVDLGASYPIDAISLWGAPDFPGASSQFPAASQNLRVYVSNTKPAVLSPTAYADLEADPDVVQIDMPTVAVTATTTVVDTLSGIENVAGTRFADTLKGNEGDNQLEGLEGDDVLSGRSGGDMLYGGDGQDAIDGDDGDDTLLGEAGRDTIRGGAGNDVIQQDFEAYVPGSSGVWDILDGGDGTDMVDYSFTVFPDARREGADGGSTDAGIDANLLTGQAVKYRGAGFSVYDKLIGIENLVGTDINDVLTGDDGANVMDGGDGKDVLAGNGGDDMLMGGDGNDTASGGTGNDILAGESGTDSIDGGDGDDLILQDIEAAGDTLRGGSGNDTVDYSVTDLAGRATTGIVARLDADGKGNGTVDKTLDGTYAAVGARGQYIRIYHNDTLDPNSVAWFLSLTGLKVFAGGRDVAAGIASSSGADDGFRAWESNNPGALTDADVGGAWNGKDSSRSNVAYAYGTKKPYIELNLGSVQSIDSIALWGRDDSPLLSDKLRVYVSETPFKVPLAALGLNQEFNPSYDDLAGNADVTSVDIQAVATTPTSTFTDTLAGIENVIGTALNDTLIGDAKANALSGGEGNDVIDGGAGNDALSGGTGTDTVRGGEGDDQIAQRMKKAGDTLDGGAGIDTVDYSVTDLTGQANTGIVADLVAGTVKKVFAGTSAGIGMQGRYIRIYHNDAVSSKQPLSLSGLKVFAGGVDVAAGRLTSKAGADGGDYTGVFNSAALTDAAVGGNSRADERATAGGTKAYIELDLGSQQNIESIALWGVADGFNYGNNLRVYVSDTAFDASSNYASLAAKADGSVGMVDLASVDVDATTTAYDRLSGVENLVGTALADSLVGDANANALSGGFGNDTLAGAGGDDSLAGDFGDDSLDGGTGNDRLAGGTGSDTVRGGDGDDTILQNMERGVSDLLDGGAGTDTVDYGVTDLTGIASQGITADLNLNAEGFQLVTRFFAGTAASADTTVWGRYIRIYHNDALPANAILSLTGLKVFAGGVDVAAGRLAAVGVDGGGAIQNYANSQGALTDATVGGAWNGKTGGSSNLAWVQGGKGYIELDLGSAQAIDTLALWGRADGASESGNLRIYVSDTAFGSSATYASLLANPAVALMEVQAVDVTANVSMVDRLKGIENLIGTALADNLKGDGNKNALFGKEGQDTISGMAGDDFLAGDAGNDSVDGGAGNDVLSGGAGVDIVRGGDGDDIILQDMERTSGDTLDGGAGTDLVDYSAGDSDMAGGINANLATGKAQKLMAGTLVSVGGGASGRYIRIYHNDAVAANAILSLTGLKVYAGGVDVAAGKQAVTGADSGTVQTYAHNPSALTDQDVGAAWNGKQIAASNLAWVGLQGGSGLKAYIELDLGSVQAIDSIALWGRGDGPGESGNLRVYVSEAKFDTVYSSAATAYADLAASPAVGKVELQAVDTAPVTTFTDTLAGIENLIGTAMNDSLTGSDGANVLTGGAGNDVLDGGKGNDTLSGGAGVDTARGGDGDDLILQDAARAGDTLEGGAGVDTADYSPVGVAGRIVANLNLNAQGKQQVTKVLSAANVATAGVTGRYIRIYHNDNLPANAILSLTGLKVYAGGVDVAAGRAAGVGADGGAANFANYAHSISALTDADLGVDWNGQSGLASNLAWVSGNKGYIELDLGSQYALDSLSLWSRGQASGESDNLRVYISGTAFKSSATAYAELGLDGAVSKFDVATTASVTLYDTLDNIESLTGTGMDDTLTGDGGANALLGGAGNDMLYGGSGKDKLYGGDGNDTLDGGDGEDSVYGEAGNDYLNGGNGNDTLDGGGGNDVLDGGNGNDTLYGQNDEDILAGGAGDDQLYGGSGKDKLYGGDGNDTLDGGDGEDSVYGEAGNDYLNGGNGNDTLGGGNGNDALYGEGGDDFIDAGANNDTLWGGSGNDTLWGSDGDDAVYGEDGNDGLDGAAGNDAMYGGAGNDKLLGGEGDDVLDGGAGDDELYGQGGNDVMAGGEGTDRFDGGEGSDTLDGQNGNDYLNGGGGNDKLLGAEGDDVLDGGAGDDELYGQGGNDVMAGGEGTDRFDGGEGNDTLDGQNGNDYLNGGAGNDKLLGGEGNDQMDGGVGDDELYGQGGNDVMAGGEGADRFDGGEGNDTLDGQNGNDNLNGGGGHDTLAGGAGNDTLSGNDGDDRMEGQDGDDVLWGGNDRDVLGGGNGNDRLYGEAGDDFIDAGANNDNLWGGSGNDTLWGGTGDDTLYGEGGNDGLDGAAGNDAMYGGAGDDGMSAGDGNDRLWGEDGNDSLSGNSGNDTVEGGAGNDVLYGNDGDDRMEGQDGDDVLWGGNDRDVLGGGNGNDRLYGEAGDDFIDAGANNDNLWGGSGNDTLWGSTGDDTLYGEDGNDGLDGAAGNDAMYGGAGDDTVFGGTGNDNLDGGDGNDVLDGGADNDSLWGQTGNDIMYGGDGDDWLDGRADNDVLYGNNGNDTLNGGFGNDTVIGGLGSDRYNFGYFGFGEGVEVLKENDATPGNKDEIHLGDISFDPGYSFPGHSLQVSQVWFRRVDNDLEISAIGKSDRLTVSDWYLGPAYRVEEIYLGENSHKLLGANVDKLVNAMAGFAPPAAGQTTLPENYQAALAPVLAANWS